MKLHNKLTHHHFDLDGRSKMRNSLAEDLLDEKMLYLMEVSRFAHNIFRQNVVINDSIESGDQDPSLALTTPYLL